MKLSYNGQALETLGDVTISQRVEYVGGDAPQQERVTLHVTLDLFKGTPTATAWTRNYADYTTLRTALGTPHGALLWQNDAGTEIYASQTATVVAHDLPSNLPGEPFHLQVNIDFQFYRALVATGNLAATLTSTGGTVVLGDILGWGEELSNERFADTTDNRLRCLIRLRLSGEFRANPASALATRRLELEAKVTALRAAGNAKNGTLVFGTFNHAVRIESINPEVDQAANKVTWTISASYQHAPDDALDWTTAEYSSGVAENYDGTQTLTVNGNVQGATEASARTRMASLLSTLLTQYGFTAALPVSESTTPQNGSGPDGTAFVRLEFNREYRVWRTDNAVATYAPTAGAAVSLPNLGLVQQRSAVERPSAWHAHRSRITHTMTLSGTVAHPRPTDTVAARRDWLLEQAEALRTAFGAAKDGVLTYPRFSETVEPTEYSAEPNQAMNAIGWSLTVTWFELEDPGDFALANYTLAESDGQAGETTIEWSGRITANSKTAALARLASLRETVLQARGYASAQPLKIDTTEATQETADGDVMVELGFSEQYRTFRTDNRTCTFTKTGGSAVDLGSVTGFSLDYSSNRFSDVRSQRRHASGTVTMQGCWPADRSAQVSTRRAALEAKAAAAFAAVNGADGTLVYGAVFNQAVRVERFTPIIDQKVNGCDWSLTANYSLFPNEAGGAIIEFNVASRGSAEEADEFLTFAGRITAPDETLARAKLATVRTAVLATGGYTLAQQVRQEVNAEQANADGERTKGLEAHEAADGTTLITFSFTEEYRRVRADALSSTLRIVERESLREGFTNVTYTGSVVAGGGTADAAYAAALARARDLGANKLPMAVGSTITSDRRQVGANGAEFIRLEFSYEYLRKTDVTTYVELRTESNLETFGQSTESITGTIIAETAARARLVYEGRIKPLFAGRTLRSERFSQATWQRGDAPLAMDGQFEFALTVFKPKASAGFAMRYMIDTDENLVEATRTVRVSGSAWAASELLARAGVEAFLSALAYGDPVSRRWGASHEKSGNVDDWIELGFEQTWVLVIDPNTVAGVLECEVNVETTYSGPRWVKQDLPYDGDGAGGIAVMQACGIEAGARNVRGRAKAATEAAARLWATAQSAYLTGDLTSGSHAAGHYPRPPRLSVTRAYVPRNGTQVRCYAVEFEFGEVLPWYPMS